MTRYVGAAGLVVMWSSGFVGARLGTAHAAVDTLLAWRYLVASAVLVLVLAAVRHRTRSGGSADVRRGLVAPGRSVAKVVGASGGSGAGVRRGRSAPRRSVSGRGGELRRQVVLGLLCQCLYLVGVVGGVGLGVPAGLAALIAVLQPLVVGALAGPVLGEPVRARQWLGLAVGLGAVGLVVGGDLDGGGNPLGYLLVAGGMLALSAGTLLERRWHLDTPLLDQLTIHSLVTTAVFVTSAAAAGRIVPPPTVGFWSAVAWVVVLSTFGGYGFYLLSLRSFGATGVSTLLNLTPPTTMLLALLMFDERVGWLGIAGLLGCACSVWLVLSGNGRATWRSVSRARPGSSTPPAASESPYHPSPTPTPRSVPKTAT